MFTGIVEEIGIIKDLKKKENLIVLSVATRIVCEGTAVGSSISVDGVCLTVTQMDAGVLTFDVMLETIRATALGCRNSGDSVNLERAVRADGRLDGHIVSGHVDRVEALKERIEGENYL
ncbi:MAG: riboflavin synthase, partial [Candidatus Omnitrophica bacterium]|nr:riboflavin synthase [Candidatus Omnitrophota bacterium]